MAFSITAQAREITGRKTDQLRAEGQVPGVIYGFDIEPTNITVGRSEFDRLYSSAGESSVIQLELGGTTHDVLIQDIQRDPLTDFAIHVDFRRVNMNQKVETHIPITITGEIPAVKALGGTLVHVLEEVEVSALPAALVRELEVDGSKLETFDDVLRVEDIVVPEGIEILTDAQVVLATISAPRTAEEMAALDEEVDASVDGVEVTSEKKNEDSEE